MTQLRRGLGGRRDGPSLRAAGQQLSARPAAPSVIYILLRIIFFLERLFVIFLAGRIGLCTVSCALGDMVPRLMPPGCSRRLLHPLLRLRLRLRHLGRMLHPRAQASW